MPFPLLEDDPLLPEQDEESPGIPRYTPEEEDEIIRRGTQAERLMNDDAFDEVVTELQQSTIESWVTAESADERERLHQRINVLRDIQFELMSRVDAAATIQAYRDFDDVDDHINGGIL